MLTQIVEKVNSNFFRRYKDDSVYYDNEKLYNQPMHGNHGLEGFGGWDVVSPEMNHSIPVQLFPKHVMDLHMNQVFKINVAMQPKYKIRFRRNEGYIIKKIWLNIFFHC